MRRLYTSTLSRPLLFHEEVVELVGPVLERLGSASLHRLALVGSKRLDHSVSRHLRNRGCCELHCTSLGGLASRVVNLVAYAAIVKGRLLNKVPSCLSTILR